MATLLHSEPRRLCSWLWDSHVCPKNSKWLQENLTEMDAKVRAMFKIINEDADSFARRAEMYCKKRPELIKLVEDFYRAYRALAERYDHVTGELRLAHRTMPEAFPNQVHSMPSTSEPHLPVSISPHLVRAFFYPDESDFGLSRKGLKQLVEMFQTGDEKLGDKDSISEHCSCLSSDENQSCNAETVMQCLKEALVKMEAESDSVLVEYRQSLEKISNLEKELDSAQNDVKELSKHANEAQSEAKALKESFEKLEAERDSSLDQYNLASQKLVSLEAAMVTIQEETTKWSDQAVKAETECQSLKLELSIYEDEKQDALHRYEWSLEKISVVEEKLLVAEENAKQIYEQIDLAENEIKVLKEEFSRLSKEKDHACFRYHQCLDTISKLWNELMETKEDIKRLNSEILSGSKKLMGAEDRCSQLEKMNLLLRNEAKNLVQKIAERDQELFQNQTELEELMNHLQVEQSRFVQVEATLNSLQNLHFQSQEEQRALTLKLSNGLQMLKNLERCMRDLELEIQSLWEENQELNDHKSASSVVKREMENEVLSVKEIKEKLESKVRRQAEKNDAFEQQVHQLNKETEVLNKKYKDILQQVESAGIDPKHVRSSIEELRHKNSRFKGISREEKTEKEALLKKLEDMEEKSSILESYLSDLHIELESSTGTMKAMQETCDSLSGEKLAPVAEKSALLFKIQIFNESIQNLLKKNVSLEDSLFNANTELEGLREKLNMLEDLECENMMQYLEKSSLREANECLDTEVDLLNEEIEACKCREVILKSELNERSCDLELWEDVAISYYFDLQTSSVREALFESKIHELSGLCNILEDLNVRRCIEIERMKDKISFLESKNKGLETQLAAYVPVILSLKNNIASLEQNLVPHTKVHLNGTTKEQEFTVNDIPERHPPNADDKSSSMLDGLSELQDLQSQIQTIENILIAERFSIQKYMNADIEHATKMKGIEELNSRINLQPHQIFRDVEFWSAPGTPDIMDETYTKDILLHQMLEFAENTDLKATELNEVGNGKIILERLSSDAQELERLNLSVKELKRKIKTNKKCNLNSNSTKAVEYKRLSGQLQDIEDSIVHLVDVNTKLIKTIKESSSSISVDSVELAKARKEAEKIGRLQLDVQKIQYLLLKLEDDKAENKKGKSRSLRSQTGVNLSDFLYSHGRRNRKQRKVHKCGCDSADVLDPCIKKFVKLDNKFTSMPNTVNFLSLLKR